MSVLDPRLDLRQAVRDVIREVLANKSSAAPREPEPVRIDDDVDLAKFVASLLDRLENPEFGRRLRSGGHRFTLAREQVGKALLAEDKPLSSTVSPVLEGVVTEARLTSLTSGSGTVTVSASAVLTPLARDTARARN